MSAASCDCDLYRTRVAAAVGLVQIAMDTSDEDMSWRGWHMATGLLGRDDAIIEVADQLGDQRVKVTKTCAGFIVWTRPRT